MEQGCQNDDLTKVSRLCYGLHINMILMSYILSMHADNAHLKAVFYKEAARFLSHESASSGIKWICTSVKNGV